MEPKNQQQSKGLHQEPGRRYVAGRVRPRAGADVRKTPHPPVKPTAPAAANKQVSPASPGKAKPALPRTSKSLVLKRQMVEHAKEHKKKVRRMHRRHIVAFAILSTFLVSVAVLAWSFQDVLPFKLPLLSQSETVQPQSETKVIESTLDETSVTADEMAAYKMADDAPRLLHIPKLELNARVKRVGATLNGDPIAPDSIYDVGWFEQNGKPGGTDAVVINGHSVGPTKNGIFANLRQLQPGDQVILELGNGTQLTYVVSKVQEYPLNQLDMEAAIQPLDPTKRGLNLITTSNRYSSRSENSRKQVIVFTHQQVN